MEDADCYYDLDREHAGRSFQRIVDYILFVYESESCLPAILLCHVLLRRSFLQDSEYMRPFQHALFDVRKEQLREGAPPGSSVASMSFPSGAIQALLSLPSLPCSFSAFALFSLLVKLLNIRHPASPFVFAIDSRHAQSEKKIRQDDSTDKNHGSDSKCQICIEIERNEGEDVNRIPKCKVRSKYRKTR